MKLDIILVSYNSEKYIDKCIKSIISNKYDLKNIGIYVYDNNSKDNSIKLLNEAKEKYQDKFHEFMVINGNKNLGFGLANNYLSKYAKGDYLFLLNIDCEIYEDTLSKIEEEISKKEKNIGIYELKQEIYEHPKYYDPITGYTEWASGACMIIRKDLFKKIKGFDKNIFLYCEDVEISFKVRKKGYKIKYLRNIPIVHHSYEEAYEFKKSQYVNTVPNNLYLRFKYGSLKDIIKGYALYLLFYKDIHLNNQIPNDKINDIKKEIKKNKNKMFFLGIIEWIKRIIYIFSKHNLKVSFISFDYSAVKEGPFYQIKKIKDNPLVSIIVRTCNRPKVLRETLISLRQQSYKNLEIIIVEDGKNTAEDMIKNEFSDLNIKYYAMGKNVGRCKAGNKALSMATGKYLNFLDDDDLFYEDHVETLVGELENSEYMVAYAASFETPLIVKSKDPYVYDILDIHKGIYNSFNNLKLFYNNITTIQAVMFRREVYQELGGFDLELDNLEDWELWLRYSLKYPFKYVDRTTSIYRVPGIKKDATNRQKVMNNYIEKVREKYKNKEINVNMQDVYEFSEYLIYLNTTTLTARIRKIKKILGRDN